MIGGGAPPARRRGLLCALLLCVWAAPYAWLPWSVPHPPLQDLPAHSEVGFLLGRVRAGDPATTERYLRHAQPWPNSLGYELMHATAPHVGGYWNAARFWTSASALAWPLAVAAFAVAVGRSPWLAFLALPTVLDFSWAAGFYNYLLAKPLVLLAVALAIGFARRGGAGRGLLLAAALVLVLVGHALCWLYALVGSGLAILCFAPGRGRLLRQWPLALAAPAALPYWLNENATGGTAGRWQWNDPLRALSEGWLHLGDLTPGWTEELAYAAAVALWLALWIFAPAARAHARTRAGTALLVALAACFAASYAWGPLHLPLAHVIVQRHVVFLFVLLLLLPHARIAGRWRLGLAAAMGAAVVVHAVGVADRYRRFEVDEMTGFDALLAELPQGSRVAAFWQRAHTPHTFTRALWHWPKLHAERGGGTTNDSFAFLHRSYVTLTPAAREAGAARRGALACQALGDWDFLLVHGGDAAELAERVGACTEPLATESAWHLRRVNPHSPRR